jgi:hypothetical protein
MNIENIQHLKELHDEIKNHPYRSSFDKSLGYDFRRKVDNLRDYFKDEVMEGYHPIEYKYPYPDAIEKILDKSEKNGEVVWKPTEGLSRKINLWHNATEAMAYGIYHGFGALLCRLKYDTKEEFGKDYTTIEQFISMIHTFIDHPDNDEITITLNGARYVPYKVGDIGWTTLVLISNKEKEDKLKFFKKMLDKEMKNYLDGKLYAHYHYNNYLLEIDDIENNRRMYYLNEKPIDTKTD